MKKFPKLKFNLEKISEFGVYLFAFLLPLQTRIFLKQAYLGGEYWELGSYSIYLIDFIILFLFTISTIVIYKKGELKIKKVWYFFAFFEFFVFLSIFFADIKYIAIYGYAKIFLALAVFFILTEIKYKEKHFILSFLLGVFIQSLIAILQHIYNFSFANKYLGMAIHNPENLGTFVLELENKTRILRSYAGFGHPNTFSFFIFIGIFVLVRYLLNLENKKNISIKSQLGYFLLLSIFFVAFLFSFSRTAYALFLFYLIFLFIWSFIDLGRRKYIHKILFSFFLIFFLFSIFNYSLLTERISSQSRLNNISNIERVNQLKECGRVIKNNYVFGVGISSYSSKLRLMDSVEKESWEYPPIHNVFILVLAEIGIFGFISFLSIFAYFIYMTLKYKLYFDFFLILSLFIVFFFDHYMWSFHFGIIFLFFIFALIQKRLNQEF